MTGRSEFLYERFLKKFSFGPTECQDRLFREVAEFVTCDDADILVVNGYAFYSICDIICKKLLCDFLGTLYD